MLDQILEADGELFSRGILRELAAGAFSDLSRSKDLLVQILVLTVAFSFFHHFMNLFENSQISKTGFYLYFLILMVLLMRSYLLMDQLLQQVLEQTVEVMQAVIPAFCMTMVFASAQTTAAVFYQISLAVIWLVERLLCYVVAPGITYLCGAADAELYDRGADDLPVYAAVKAGHPLVAAVHAGGGDRHERD